MAFEVGQSRGEEVKSDCVAEFICLKFANWQPLLFGLVSCQLATLSCSVPVSFSRTRFLMFGFCDFGAYSGNGDLLDEPSTTLPCCGARHCTIHPPVQF